MKNRLVWRFGVLFFLTSALFCLFASAAPMIRVGLNYGTSSMTSVDVACDAGLTVMSQSGTADAAYSVRTISENGGITVYDGDDVLLRAGSIVTLYPANGSTPLSYGGKKYRGVIELRMESNGSLTVINELCLDDYLCGVLPNEIYPSWHPEALKAFAIAARTYTCSRVDSSPHKNYNVCSTTHCQAYGGCAKEYPSTNTAIQATADVILTYNGKPATATYHSSSGGATESAKVVWGSDVPYLVSVVTPYERYRDVPNGKWVSVIAPSELRSKLSSGYAGKISYATLDIDSFSMVRQPSGYISDLTVTDANGKSVSIHSADSVRSFFGSLVKSANFGMAEGYVPSASNGQSVHIVSPGGEYVSDLSEGADYIDANGQVQHTSGLSRVLIFDGQGFGHGVGMSQFGCSHMADAGFSYTDILDTYYPGTVLGMIN